MKIQEIISTNTELEEGLLSGAWQLIKGFRGQVIDDAVKALASGNKYAGKVTPAEVRKTINALGPKARQAAMKDASIYDDVLKKANDARNPGAWQKTKNFFTGGSKNATNAASVGLTASKAGKVVKAIASLGMSTYYYALLWEPLSLYLDNMNNAEEYLAAGKVPNGTPDGTTPQEWFDDYRQSQMSQLIGKWAIIWAGGKLAKMPFGAASKLVGGISPTLGSAMTGLGRVGQLAMMSWLTSPENSKEVAEFMAGPLVSGVVGGVGVQATDAVKNALGMASAKDRAAPTANEPSHNGPSQGASDTEPGAKQDKEEPAAQDTAVSKEEKARQEALANPANWVYSSPGMVKNKVTGDVDYVTNHK